MDVWKMRGKYQCWIKVLDMNRCTLALIVLTVYSPLSLGGHVESQEIKSFVFARQASPRREFSARLAVQ